jgi:predicted nucleic acid-binding protein
LASSKVVANASPLIYLSVLNRFHLLKDLFGEVYLSEAVYREVVVEGAGQPGAAETQTAVTQGWLQQIAVRDRIAVDALLDELHLGEAEAIVLARELSVGRVLLDDRAARTKARLMGLTVTGTIGILILAKKAGVEIDLRRALDILIQQNFRISLDLYDTNPQSMKY